MLRSVAFDTVFERLELAWKNYCTQGRFEWTRRGPGATRAVVSGVRGFNGGMWFACAGRTEALLGLTGARNVQIEVVDPRPDSCTFDATWKG